MKKQLLIFSGLLLCVIIMGCKKTHCPAFPKAIADTYFPYTENSVLHYSNTNGDTLTFKIERYVLSDNYSYDWNCDCACDAYASFRTERDPLSLRMDGIISLDDYRVGIEINIQDDFWGNRLYFYIDGINPYASNNARLFGDTLNLTTNKPNDRITSVKVIAEKGITRFFDAEQDCKWVLVEGK